MYGTSGTRLKLRRLTPGEARREMASKGFPSVRLVDGQAAYVKRLIQLAEKSQDAEDAEAAVFAVALITGIDTGEPTWCAGCGCFTEKPFLRGGLCPDCDGENY